MRVLAISSAYDGCTVGFSADGVTENTRSFAQDHGLAAALPMLVNAVLTEAPGKPDIIAVCIGPGSFTGLRAGLSIAAGIGLALGIQVVGVTAAEALRAGLETPGRPLWVAISARRDRLFLDIGPGMQACAPNDVPHPSSPVAIAGNAATLVAATLAARGANVMLTGARQPRTDAIAAVAERRAQGLLPPLQPLPLYIDAPEAKLPAGGLRPAPERVAP